MGLLRFFLALAVLSDHTKGLPFISPVTNTIPVQAFFLISGFYMSLILHEKYVGTSGSYRLFISNRMLRLFPVYWIIATLIVCYSLFQVSRGGNPGQLTYFFQHGDELGIGSWIYIVLSNLLIVGQDIIMFLGLTPNGGLEFVSDFRQTEPQLWSFLIIPPAWSIAIEIMFYLVAPFILRQRLRIIILLIGISCALRIAAANIGLDHDPWTYRFFPFELALFLGGRVSYDIYKKLEHFSIPKPLLLVVGGLFLVWTTCFEVLDLKQQVASAVIYLLVLIPLVPILFSLSKHSKIDRFIGELSYPIYLSHLFIYYSLKSYFLPEDLHFGVTTAILSIALSSLIIIFVSDPLDRFRQARLKAMQH